MAESRSELTVTLLEVAREAESDDLDEREVLDRLVPLVYEELRSLAHFQIRKSSVFHTFDTTGLVNEAYVRLVESPKLPLRSKTYFFGAATRAMRNVLVEAARKRTRVKRGGRNRPIPLDESTAAAVDAAEEILQIDELVSRLAEQHPRAARVLEARIFGGLTVEETAETLGVSKRTVNRDETFARAWLRNAAKE